MPVEQSAKVIEHTISPDGHELITVEIRNYKPIDAEYEKHCMVASNSSSDRAIPVAKMLSQDPYVPKDIRYNQSGMQGKENLTDGDYEEFSHLVRELHNFTSNIIKEMQSLNIHKQHTNRYLLPFSMQTKVMTATAEEWGYFFGLRHHPDADPNINEVANLIVLAMAKSYPRKIDYTEWHLPYITEDERKSTKDNTILCKISSSRCARASYKSNATGKLSTVDEDLQLFERLAISKPQHLSPLDHQGKPIYYSALRLDKSSSWPIGATHMTRGYKICSGKMKNFICFRHYYLQKEAVNA